MKSFKESIQELHNIMSYFIILNTLLTAIVFFLVLYLVLVLFNFFPHIAFFPALVYFFIKVYLELSKKKEEDVEQHYPILNEKLRTAVDNIDVENTMVEALQQEVEGEMKDVTASSFASTRHMLYKSASLIGLAFVIIIIASINFQIYDVKGFIEGASFLPDLGDLFDFSKLTQETVPEEDETIFSDEAVITLGGEQINVQIKPIGFEVDLREVSEGASYEFGETFPKEVFFTSGGTYEENIPKEHAELIKNYFANEQKQ